MRTAQILSLIIGMAFTASCSSGDAPDNIEPRLAAGTATDITRTEATLTGRVTLQGNTQMPVLKFMYGTTETMSQSTEALTATDNSVSARLTGLTAGTHYYYCLTGSNGRATLQSTTLDFTTEPNDKPTVGTLTTLSQGPVSVIVGYTVTDDGGETLTETGCYITEAGQTEPTKITTDPTDATDGTYSVRVSGLKQNTSYTLQAFATNRSGESLGGTLQHTTADAVSLTTAGELSFLMGDALYDCTTLSFEGPMNGSDFRCLRQMVGIDTDGTATSGQLSEVNLADVKICDGGESYDGERFTTENTVSTGLFAGCTQLTSLVLPDETTTIEQDALSDCTSLTTLLIPASTEAVSPSSGCTALESINVSAANKNFTSIDGVLFDSGATALLWFPLGKTGSYTLPSTVTEIGARAFKGCCITTLTLPDNITEMGMAAFYGSKVEEVFLPDALKTVPTSTFQECSNLKTVHIGSGAQLMADYLFDGCPLTDLYVKAQTPPVCNADAFTNNAEDIFTTCTLHVPAGRKTIYRSHSIWGQFKKIVED